MSSVKTWYNEYIQIYVLAQSSMPTLSIAEENPDPRACAGFLSFYFKKSNLLNILRYILFVSSNFCDPSPFFRALPFFPFSGNTVLAYGVWI